jgi:hypothetical protein
MLIVFWLNECKEKNILPSKQHNLRIFNNYKIHAIGIVNVRNFVRVLYSDLKTLFYFASAFYDDKPLGLLN